MSSDVNSEFKLVTRKKGKKISKCPKTDSPLNDQGDKDTTLRRVLEAKTEVKSSDLLTSALASLREGRIGECMISRYQFAFLLCLKEFYNVDVKVYDPVFAELDCWLLEQFDCIVLRENCEGKFQICDKSTRIFYLPHCPKQLTNNLLWANWGLDLNYCVIIANSFNTIVEKSPKRELNTSAEYILKIVPHVLELAMINSFRFYEIFNDTAIHIFPYSNIQLLSDDFWSHHDEPDYSDDVEFITNKFVLLDP